MSVCVSAGRGACASDPCRNGGTCLPVSVSETPEGYVCKCLSRFTGAQCQTGNYQQHTCKKPFFYVFFIL